MKALFLAAGFSTRLAPLTDNQPKGLLEISGRPIISALLDQVVKLQELGEIEEIAIITNDRDYEAYHQFFHSDSKHAFILINNGIARPQERLGAIGDLSLALDVLDWQDDLLVLPSDTLSSIKLEKMLAFYRSHPGFINAVFDSQDVSEITGKLGCAVVENDRLVQFVEKPALPPSTLQSIPIYIYPAQILPLIKEYEKSGQNLDSPGAIIPWLIEHTTCYAYQQTDGYYFDVGTPEMYHLLKNKSYDQLSKL